MGEHVEIEALPALPRSKWTDGMVVWSTRTMATEMTVSGSIEWPLEATDFPEVATRDGYRLPREITHGLLCSLASTNPFLDPWEYAQPAYRLTEFLTPASAERLFSWVQDNSGQFPDSTVYDWESLFEAPEHHLEVWEKDPDARPRVIQVMGYSHDRNAALLAWHIRHSGDPIGEHFSPLLVDYHHESLSEFLYGYLPTQLPCAFHDVAKAWLEQCAEDAHEWTFGEWRELCATVDWFGEAAVGLVWYVRELATCVRLDPSGGFFGQDESRVEVSEAMHLSVAHHSRLDDATVLSWARLFWEDEVLQPFDQLRIDRRTSQNVG